MMKRILTGMFLLVVVLGLLLPSALAEGESFDLEVVSLGNVQEEGDDTYSVRVWFKNNGEDTVLPPVHIIVDTLDSEGSVVDSFEYEFPSASGVETGYIYSFQTPALEVDANLLTLDVISVRATIDVEDENTDNNVLTKSFVLESSEEEEETPEEPEEEEEESEEEPEESEETTHEEQLNLLEGQLVLYEDDLDDLEDECEEALEDNDKDDIEDAQDDLDDLEDDVDDFEDDVRDFKDDVKADSELDADAKSSLLKDINDLLDDINDLQDDIDDEQNSCKEESKSKAVFLSQETAELAAPMQEKAEQNTKVVFEELDFQGSVEPASTSQDGLNTVAWSIAGIVILLAVIVFLVAVLLR